MSLPIRPSIAQPQQAAVDLEKCPSLQTLSPSVNVTLVYKKGRDCREIKPPGLLPIPSGKELCSLHPPLPKRYFVVTLGSEFDRRQLQCIRSLSSGYRTWCVRYV